MCYFVVLRSSLLSKLKKCEGLLALREKQYKELGMETRDFAIAELTQLKNTIADIKNDLATHQYRDNLKDAKEQNHALPENFSNSLNSFVPERNWDETNFPGLIRTKDGLYIFQTSGHSCQFSDGTKFISNPESEANIKKIWDFLTVEREFREIPCDDPGIKLSASIQYMKEVNLQKLAAIHDCAHLYMANGDRKPFFLVAFMVIDALIKMGLRDRFPRVICGNATKETQRSKPDEKVWDLMNMGY